MKLTRLVHARVPHPSIASIDTCVYGRWWRRWPAWGLRQRVCGVLDWRLS